MGREHVKNADEDAFIVSYCTECGRAVKAPAERRGKGETCPYCHGRVVIGQVTRKPVQRDAPLWASMYCGVGSAFCAAAALLLILALFLIGHPVHSGPFGRPVIALTFLAIVGGVLGLISTLLSGKVSRQLADRSDAEAEGQIGFAGTALGLGLGGLVGAVIVAMVLMVAD